MFLPDDYYALEDYTDKKGAMSAIVEDVRDKSVVNSLFNVQ